MNIIEQRIRMHIQKQLMLEARNPSSNPSGYEIKIPGTKLVGELNRWRVERIDAAAKENGCLRGFLIVAKPVNKNVNDSLLVDDIVDTMRTHPQLSTYYGNDYRIILSNPTKLGKRKIYAAWILDMRINNDLTNSQFRILLNKLQEFQKKSVYVEFQNIQKYLIGTTDVILQPQAIEWTNSIRKYLKKIEIDTPDFYKQQFPGTKKVAAQLASIPNFSKMNRNIVDTAPVDLDADAAAAESLTTINREWIETNEFQTSFRGTAIINIDPITARTTLQPVNGSIEFLAVRRLQDGDDETYYFTGQFENGAPANGIMEPMIRGSNEETKYTGKLTSTSLIAIANNSDRISKFRVARVEGRQFYFGSGTEVDDGDQEASYFEGTFSNDSPSNGNYYERESNSAPYALISKVINGKYIKQPKPIKLIPAKYPYTDPGGIKIYYDANLDPVNVYAWIADKNAWVFTAIENHTKLVNNMITSDDFQKLLNYSTFPTSQLFSTTFGEGPKYVILKDNQTEFEVWPNNKKKPITYKTTADPETKKLVWTGEYDATNKYYSVLFKSPNGQYIDEMFFIAKTLVKNTETPYN